MSESAAPAPRVALRVLYSFPLTFGAPGVGSTAFHQVRELVRAGHEVTLVAANIVRPVPGVRRVITTLAVGGHRVPHRVLGIGRSLRVHDAWTARVLRSSAGSFDVVHAWPNGCLTTLRAAAALGVPALREVPNTHTAHAVAVVQAESAALGLAVPQHHSHREDAHRIAEEELEYAAACALLVPSESSARTFLDRGVAPARLLRHRYGYDPAELGVPDRAPRAPGAPLRVLFLGRCEPRKGLHHALRAWGASGLQDGDRLDVVGAFVPGYREVLGPLLSQPGVHVHGFSPVPGSHLARADVLLLPSVEEGSALVTYEAQAAGCALLVSSATGAVLQDDVQGLLHAPGDVAGLSRQLDRLRTEPGLLDRFSAAATAAAPDLTWSRSSEVLVEAYRAAIGAPAGGWS